jgi:prepilin signal peptidase PulO-like enzyme (type II secretory pathway)
MHLKKSKRVRMEKFVVTNWTEISEGLGVGIGFINFYVLYYSWHISWEISFAVAFVLGYLASVFFNDYVGNKLDKTEAKDLYDAVEKFEEK